MYQLDAPFYFYFFTIIPVLWVGFLLVEKWKHSVQIRFAQSSLMEKLSPNRSNFKPALKLFLLTLGVSFLMGKKIKNNTHQITTKNKKYENICIIF